MMHHFLCSLLLLTISTIAHAQSTILESEALRWRAQVERDTVLLNKLLTDDLVYIHSNALTESKSDFLHSVQSGSITYHNMQGEPGGSIRQYGKTGISNGIVRATGLLNGTPFEVRLRYTAVYVRQKGRWRLASWQSTRM